MPLESYRRLIETGELEPDEEQLAIISVLDALAVALEERSPVRSGSLSGRRSLLSRLFGRPEPMGDPVQGLYLWGGVGRGKTLLCDLFFENLRFEDRLRLHFHRFMQRVHAELRALGHIEDPLPQVANHIADEARLLLLDEIHVHDITDAMLLGRLQTELFARRVTLVTTSNIPPGELYKGGLQRARFLPAIEQIERHCRVVQMGAGEDYRLRLLQSGDTYLVGNTARGRAETALEEKMQAWFDRLRRADAETDTALEINGRQLPVRALADDIVWMDFATLCSTPRSTHDYIEIATDFKTVLVSDIPVLDDTRNDEARRLVNLIDEFYDRRINLIATAEAPPNALYRGKRLAFEFQRAASRLTEMQTVEYLGAVAA